MGELRPNQGVALAKKNSKQPNAVVLDLLVEILKTMNGGETRGYKSINKEIEQEVIFSAVIDGSRYSILRTYLPRGKNKKELSPRESEIARLVAKGYPNKAIAAVLDISPWTVATHMRRIYSKLGVNSRAEMVAIISRYGLLIKAIS